jgi:hypothetical protein
MHWTATDDRYHEALRRLAVILFALAGIAEGAACRFSPVRYFLLWRLRGAEERVRGFAARQGAVPPSVDLSMSFPRDGAGEGTRLAGTFRALAAMFLTLARPAPQWLRAARRHRLSNSRRREMLPGRHGLSDGQLYADTS